MRPSKKTLARLKTEIHVNAVRLFCDACILFENRSYPSSYALAILSLEELGKLEMVAHICDDISINPDSNPQDFLDHLLSRSMFFSHKNKQMWGSDPWFSVKSHRLRAIAEGKLDRAKQDAFYVGHSKGRIRSPERVSSVDAFAELLVSFRKIKQVGDLGFNGFYCQSDARSRKQAKRYSAKAEKLFVKIRRPKYEKP